MCVSLCACVCERVREREREREEEKYRSCCNWTRCVCVCGPPTHSIMHTYNGRIMSVGKQRNTHLCVCMCVCVCVWTASPMLLDLRDCAVLCFYRLLKLSGLHYRAKFGFTWKHLTKKNQVRRLYIFHLTVQYASMERIYSYLY